MADLIVNGGKPLCGTITPSGNKNSVLPILCATLLTDDPVTLTNVPDITDLNKLVSFMQSQGSVITWDKLKAQMQIDHSRFKKTLASDELPQDMRSTVLLFPGLLKRFGGFVLNSESKGCTLGVREIVPHLDILKALGAEVHDGDALRITLKNGFKAGRQWTDYMSVTVTENFAMAACTASGKSELINAASEPHVQDLCEALVT